MAFWLEILIGFAALIAGADLLVRGSSKIAAGFGVPPVVIGLTLVNLIEWPLLLSRGMNEWLYLTVPLRTVLLALLAAVLWRRVEE